MKYNLIILFASFSLLVIIYIYSKVNWYKFSVINVYFVFIGLYFGVYPFIKALLNNYSNANPLAITLVFLQIFIILGIILCLVRYLPMHMKGVIDIRFLIGRWSEANIFIIFLLLGIILMVQIIGYGKFGIISHVNHEELAGIGRKLPYWYAPALFLLNDIILCTFIGLIVKLIKSKDLTRKILIISLVILVGSASIYGRRSLINLAVIGTLLWFISQEKDVFQFKYLKIGIILLVGLFIFSNIFQLYRGILQFPPSITLDQNKNPIAAIFDGNATLSNIRERPATWEFNYLIVESQLTGKGTDFPRGTLIWQGLKNSIPSILWPGKVVRSLNDMTAILYGFPVMDYGKNNFAFAQADFGVLSIIIVPIVMMIIFLTLIIIIRITKNNPTLLLILSGIVINYLINIEQNVADIFILYRNLIVFTIIYMIGPLLLKIKYLKFRIPGLERVG